MHGYDKSLQWAWSGGPRDETHVPSIWHGVHIVSVARVLGLGEDLIKEEGNNVLFSNNLWNVLGGRSFTTILQA
jgi:hypothetical protein